MVQARKRGAISEKVLPSSKTSSGTESPCKRKAVVRRSAGMCDKQKKTKTRGHHQSEQIIPNVLLSDKQCAGANRRPIPPCLKMRAQDSMDHKTVRGGRRNNALALQASAIKRSLPFFFCHGDKSNGDPSTAARVNHPRGVESEEKTSISFRVLRQHWVEIPLL